MLENNAAALYSTVAAKTNTISVQCILKKIATDSKKHSSLLEEMSEKLVMPRAKSIENITEFGDAFKIIYVMQKDAEVSNEIDNIELLTMSAKLAILEKVLNEKYSIMQDRISKIVNRSFNLFQTLSIDSYKSFFERIAHDEVEHQNLLASIQAIVGVPNQPAEKVSFEVNIPSPIASQINVHLGESSSNKKEHN